jgi:hypothetical protein
LNGLKLINGFIGLFSKSIIHYINTGFLSPNFVGNDELAQLILAVSKICTSILVPEVSGMKSFLVSPLPPLYFALHRT